MLKYFKLSIIVAIVCLISAYFWGEYKIAGAGFLAVFIAAVLAVLETSLSFDNAVINATKLEKMTKVWQHRFLTWGIIIAVFGMRLVFPIAIVSVFAHLPFWQTAQITVSDIDTYARYLHMTHAPVMFFGAAFLLMLFFHYFFDENKEIHWIKFLEDKMQKIGNMEGLEILLTLITIYIFQGLLPMESRLTVVLSALNGVMLYILIHGLSKWMEEHAPKADMNSISTSFKAGLVSFLYLELIDASFSLDGVLGAFALSKDIIIITLGLTIGAMFVRSFTIMLVEKKTLKQYVFLEHGAHWAIGILAIIMFLSTMYDIPEVVTGLTGLILIVWSFISSIRYNKAHKEQE